MAAPEYEDRGFPVYTMPEVVERVLKQHLGDDDIHVTLHAPRSDIPEQHKRHVEYAPKGTMISTPVLAFSECEKGKTGHLWVGVGNPLERVDCDGILHEDRFPIAGYMEIKGLR